MSTENVDIYSHHTGREFALCTSYFGQFDVHLTITI